LNVRSSLVAALILIAAACSAPPPRDLDPVPGYDTGQDYPHWSGRPVTWSKLGEIEEWLDGSGPRAYPEYVPSAHLELAEGRLALARREAKGLSAPLLATRLSAAERDFREVLEHPRARSLQKDRARQGLSELEALRAPKTTTTAKKRSATPTAASSNLGFSVMKRENWKAAPARAERMTAVDVPYDRITIHHSAKESDGGSELSSARDVADKIKKIQSFHMRDKGWGDIGYHFLIDASGQVWQGRALDWQGAHAGGDGNIGNIGICMLGDFSTSAPSHEAMDALEQLVDRLSEIHRISRSRVYAHKHFSKTECPGSPLASWVTRHSGQSSNSH